MGDLIQLIVSGIATGAIYAPRRRSGSRCCGRPAGVINFAQGEFVMLPALRDACSSSRSARRFWLAFLLACAAAMLVLGWGFKRVVVDPLIRHGVIPLVIATLRPVDRTQIRAEGRLQRQKRTRSRARFRRPVLRSRASNISYADVGTLLMAGAIVIGLQSFLNKTITGRAMQAVAQNTDAARVLGINVNRMVLCTFLINAVLAVVAALLVTPTYLAKFDMGDSIGQKAFFAAIIGGFNQTRGALLGGVLIGVLENVVGYYVSPAYKEGVAADAVPGRHPVPSRACSARPRRKV